MRLFRAGWILGIALLLPATADAQPPAGKPRLDRHGVPLPDEAVARIGTAAFRHPYLLYSIAFSPDGKRFAGAHGELVIWDCTTAKELKRIPLKQEHSTPEQLQFSSDGRMLLSTSRSRLDPNALLWETNTGRQLTPFDGSQMYAGAFSPDATVLAASFVKPAPAVRLWDLVNWKEIRPMEGHVKGITHLGFAEGGKKLLGTSWDNHLCCWDVASGKQLFLRERSGSGHFALDGSLVWHWEYQTGPTLVDPFTQKMKFPLRDRGQLIAFGGDGRTVIIRASDRFRLWDLRTGKEKDAVPFPRQSPHRGTVGTAALAADGKTFAVIMHGQTRLYDLSLPPAERDRGWHQQPAWQLQFSPDDKTLLSCDWPPHLLHYYPRNLYLWDPRTGAPVRPYENFDDLVYFRFLDRGQRFAVSRGLFVNGTHGGLNIQDTLTGKELHESKQPQPPLWLSSDGTTLLRQRFEFKKQTVRGGRDLFHANPGLTILQTVKIRSGEVLREVRLDGGFPKITPDGKTAFTFGVGSLTPDFTPIYSPAGLMTVWDVATGKKRFVLSDKTRAKNSSPKGGPGSGEPAPQVLAVSADGQTLAWFHHGDAVWLTDLVTGEITGKLPRTLGERRLAFSANGKTLAAIGEKAHSQISTEAVEIWELATAKVRHRFPGPDGGGHSVAFSHDGSLLASGHTDNTILVWDVWGKQSPRLAKPLTETELVAAWSDLTNPDPQPAFASMRRLFQQDRQSVPVLRERLLQFARTADVSEIPALIRALDSDRFKTRIEAAQKLRRLGVLARDPLRRSTKELATLEGRRRAERLLEELAGPLPGPWLQALRSLEVLEALRTPEASQSLETLARLDKSHPLALEARAALERLRIARSDRIHAVEQPR
jgi:WD40 repeat protein